MADLHTSPAIYKSSRASLVPRQNHTPTESNPKTGKRCSTMDGYTRHVLLLKRADSFPGNRVPAQRSLTTLMTNPKSVQNSKQVKQAKKAKKAKQANANTYKHTAPSKIQGRMCPYRNIDRSNFAPFDSRPVLDADKFIAAISIILDYFNFGNSRPEVVQIKEDASAWCEGYFGSRLFARHQLDSVLQHHPNMFNFAVLSRARLDPIAGGEDDMDVDEFPPYCEPSLFEDHVLYQLVDVVGARQASLLQQRDATDHYAHLRPQVAASRLKETEIIWNIPGVMASLARLNMVALDDGTGTPMFVDPPGTVVLDPWNAAVGCPAEMSGEDGSHGSKAMSGDEKPEDHGAAWRRLRADSVLPGSDVSEDSFQTATSGGIFCTAPTSPGAAGLGAPVCDDSRMDTACREAGEEEPWREGEAMEGVEQKKHGVLRGYLARIARMRAEAAS